MISFWEVMNRATNTGELLSTDKYDMRVFTVTSKLAQKYGLQYNPQEVAVDSETAQKVWEAGLEAYTELGTYCIDTGRIIRFSREEIEEAIYEINGMPDQITIGCGTEARILHKRKPFSDEVPLSIGGVVESNPGEGTEFVQMYKSIFQEQVTDGAYFGPAPHACEGYPWKMASPWEVQAGRNAVKWCREALRAVGRPGLHLLDASPTPIGTASSMLGGLDGDGLRPSDAVAIATIAELKVDYHMLNKVALVSQFGCLKNPYWTTVIGGFAGGTEGAAILSVAHALNAILVYRVGGHGYIVPSTIMQYPCVATTRQALWARSAAIHGITNNVNLIAGGGGLTDAGPGTEEQLWEIACLGIVFCASGGHDLQGVRKAKIGKPCQGSGLEVRWKAEVTKAAAGLDRETVNQILNHAFTKFEDGIFKGTNPPGYSFHEIYDLVTLKPTQAYQELYQKVKEELKGLGMNLR